jgi:hypothetical protein
MEWKQCCDDHRKTLAFVEVMVDHQRELRVRQRGDPSFQLNRCMLEATRFTRTMARDRLRTIFASEIEQFCRMSANPFSAPSFHQPPENTRQ